MATAEELKQQGNAYYAAGRSVEALECYIKAVQLNDAGLLHVLLSNSSAAQFQLGHFEAAAKSARKCVEAKPDWPKGYAREAQALLALHRPGPAEAALRHGLRRCPDDATLLHELNKLRQEDGNQGLLRGHFPGTPAQDMRDLQGRLGLHMHGPEMLRQLPCDAFRHAFLGNLQEFRATFRPAEHISLRAWELRTPICSVIVSGAQRVQYVEGRKWGSEHEEIMRVVCEAGARVDAKDIAGWTALAHATAHHSQIGLAQVLLEFGADPCLANRFGAAPLHNAVMGNSIDGVRLLLEAGADPAARDPSGISPLQMARYSPELLSLCNAKLGRHQENKGLQAGEACMNCGKGGATRHCPDCMTSLYCSRTCQRQHWKAVHRDECPALAKSTRGGAAGKGTKGRDERAEGQAGGAGTSTGSSGCGGGGAGGKLLRLRPTQVEGSTVMLPHSEVVRSVMAGLMGEVGPDLSQTPILGPEERQARAWRPNQKTFIVKVQVPLGVPPGTGTILIYDKTRTFQVYVAEKGADACQLASLIRQRGINKNKAFFNAFQDQQTGELVVSDAMLPIQPW